MSKCDNLSIETCEIIVEDCDFTGEVVEVEVQGLQGARGEQGFHFVPRMDKDGNLTWTNNGNLKNPEAANIKGVQGDRGFYFTPTVSPECDLSWSNNGELENPATVNIRGKQGYIFTPSVSKDSILSWTNDGGLPNPPDVNIRGERGFRGFYFTPTVDENGNISWTNDGELENPPTVNIKGIQGDQGFYFTPTVDESGNLTWTNNGGLPNPPTVNIKGQKGDSGENIPGFVKRAEDAAVASEASHKEAKGAEERATSSAVKAESSAGIVQQAVETVRILEDSASRNNHNSFLQAERATKAASRIPKTLFNDFVALATPIATNTSVITKVTFKDKAFDKNKIAVIPCFYSGDAWYGLATTAISWDENTVTLTTRNSSALTVNEAKLYLVVQELHE